MKCDVKLRVGMKVLEVRPYLSSIPSIIFDASSCIWTKHRQRSGATHTPANKQPVSQSSVRFTNRRTKSLTRLICCKESSSLASFYATHENRMFRRLSQARCKDVQVCWTRCCLITFTKLARVANRSLPDLYKILVLCLHQATSLTGARLARF